MKRYSKHLHAYPLKHMILTLIVLVILFVSLATYQDLSLYQAIRQGVEPGFPARVYKHDVVRVNDDRTRAFVRVTSIMSCQNPVGRTIDLTVTLSHTIWTISEIGDEKLTGNFDCDF